MSGFGWIGREPLTAKDRRRAAPIIYKWLDSMFDTDTDWGRYFQKYEEIFSKTRPLKPTRIYRCPSAPGETGEYDRWTSWSLDHDIDFGAGPPCWKNRIQARVWPDDIEVVLPAFGSKIYDEEMDEVILRPGVYTIFPAKSFEDLSKRIPLTQPNYPQYEWITEKNMSDVMMREITTGADGEPYCNCKLCNGLRRQLEEAGQPLIKDGKRLLSDHELAQALVPHWPESYEPHRRTDR